jgi:hypothetical protein
MNLTRNQITFLREVPSNIKVDMTSGWRHHYFEGLSLGELSSFIKLIGEDKVYLLIPFWGSSKSLSKPRLRLSDPFLVDNKSNSFLITKFIMDQWHSSGFNIKQDTTITFSLKFKRVWFSSSF